jgi:hypothetical protein
MEVKIKSSDIRKALIASNVTPDVIFSIGGMMYHKVQAAHILKSGDRVGTK